ncbi:MAG: dihydropteroate synthase [bacterium]|nr:dihydropteroate synthase [bacterium]
MADAYRHPFLYPESTETKMPMASQHYQLNCRGSLLNLDAGTKIMGILNITPDSFSDGGRYLDPDDAVAQAEVLVEEGADIIDIGGESTRPAGPYGTGAAAISLEEEIRRTIPVIEKIAARTGRPISIDTTKAEVARQALQAGASIVNDISALRFDPKMAQTVAASGAPIILMHMQGTPKTMQKNPTYKNLIAEIKSFLKERKQTAIEAGIAPENVVLDPGLGFGKREVHSHEILARLHEFHDLGSPLLIGPSRKKFTGSNLPAAERLEGTLSALAFCVAGGAHILRVHDVQAARKAVSVAERIVCFQERAVSIHPENKTSLTKT